MFFVKGQFIFCQVRGGLECSDLGFMIQGDFSWAEAGFMKLLKMKDPDFKERPGIQYVIPVSPKRGGPTGSRYTLSLNKNLNFKP